MPAKPGPATKEEELQRKIEDLELQLAEAEETMRAIREGAVDAVIVPGAMGDQVFSLTGSDSIYRLIVETMKEAAFTTTMEGSILFCNTQFGILINRPLEQVVGHRFQEFVAGSDQTGASALLNAARQQPVKQRLVFHAAGSMAVPAHVSANVLKQPGNLSICFVVSDLSDLENSSELIQQLRLQQNRLRENEERFRILMENSPDAHIIAELGADFAGCTFVDCNQAALDMLGMTSKQQLLGLNHLDVSPARQPDGRLSADIEREMRVRAVEQGSQRFEWVYRRQDGVEFTVQNLITFLRYQDRSFLHSVGHDITGLKRAEAAIKELNENLESLVRERTDQLDETVQKLQCEIVERWQAEENIGRIAREWQTTFDAIRDPVLLMSSDYRITRANDAARVFLGLPLDVILGSSYQTLFSRPRGAGGACPVTAAMASRHHEELERLDQARNAWLLTSADPILTEAGVLQGVIMIIKDITRHKDAEKQLQQSLDELQKLKDHLRDENIKLRQEMKTLSGSAELIGQSPAFQNVLLQVEQVAATDATVLLLGETGSGKEALAKAIHRMSSRRDRPLVCVNCAALPATLIENELFGREKGAYTGALSAQIGRFEMAHKATLFLDEIGDLTPELQVKLLRVLAEKQIERLGGTRTITVDVRVITATNQDLEKAIVEGRFRRDLYYRLNVFPVHVPPLRERREDIPLLVRSFVDQIGRAMGKTIESVDASDMDALVHYAWPGNIRELRNLVERALITSQGPKLRITLPETVRPGSPPPHALNDMERDYIQQVLVRTRWRIRGANGAAEILGMKPSTLESRMMKLGIRRPV